MARPTHSSIEYRSAGTFFVILLDQPHLVNVKFIKRLLRGDPGTIVMKDDTVLPLSRGRKGDLLDNF